MRSVPLVSDACTAERIILANDLLRVFTGYELSRVTICRLLQIVSLPKFRSSSMFGGRGFGEF